MKKYGFIKSALICLIHTFSFQTGISQTYEWAKNIGPGVNSGAGQSMAVDTSGNVYITGQFWGTADFDPGVGTANLTSVGTDIFFAKYDNNGNYLWAKSMGTFNWDQANSIAVDDAGNVYITGHFTDTVDFDPGIGVANLIAAGNFEIFFAKYDNNGNYLWANRIGNANWDYGNSLVVDPSGNVFLTGHFSGTVDFDAGVGTANLSSVGFSDIFFTKYDNNGNFQWAKRMGGTNNDYGNDIAIDTSGSVYIIGYFYGTVDFDPSGGTANLTSNGWSDIYFAKYDNSGNYLWAKNVGGLDFDMGNSIAVDVFGNVCITGNFENTADFDPGVGTANLTAVGTEDIYFAKYDNNGNYVWAKSIGSLSSDVGQDIAVDAYGNIYITGGIQDTVDFDPGTGTVNLISAGGYDIYIAKYNINGDYEWAKNIGSPDWDVGYSITVDAADNVYITGFFKDTADFDPGPDTANLIVANNIDIFFAKYSQCNISSFFTQTATTICEDGSINFTNTSTGATAYLWQEDTTTFSTSVNTSRTFNTAGTFSIKLIGVDGSCYDTSEVIITVNPTYALSVPNDSICAGDSILIFGLYRDTAGTYVNSLSTVNGCDSIITTTLTINPTYNIVDPAVTVCDGDSISIYGAFTSFAGSYYDSLSTNNGCDSIHSVVLTLDPTYDIIDPAVTICSNDSSSIYGMFRSVAATYYDSTVTTMGCDSVHSTVLATNPVYNITDPAMVICNGDSISIYGTFRSFSGTYYDSSNTSNGCDSISNTTLSLNQTFNISDPSIAICSGDSVSIYGIFRSFAGTSYDSSSTSNGCDSVHMTVLSITAYNVTDPSLSICDGDSILIYGTFRFIAGTYTDSLATTNGCDSLHSTSLSVNSLPTVSFTGLDTLYCSTNVAVAMTGIPIGGMFSGTGGVANEYFYPATGVNNYIVTYSYEDSSGCSNSDSQSVSVVFCLGISEGVKLPLLKIYPNPNTGEFTLILNIESPGNFEIKISNIFGQEVFSEKLVLKRGLIEKLLDLNGYSVGVYNIQLISAGEIITEQVIIE